LDEKKRQYAKKWIKLIQLEESFENQIKEDNEKEDPSFYLLELENFDDFKEHVYKSAKEENIPSITLRFSKSFPDKDALHSFLDAFKQSEQVSLTQSSLSCTVKGYLSEKKIKKIKENDQKHYIGVLNVRCNFSDSTINLGRLESLDTNEIHTYWRVINKKKSFFPFMRGNLAELLLSDECKRHRELIVDLVKPTFEEDTGQLKKYEHLYKDKRRSNDDQIEAIEKVTFAS
jgi:hypothetical protein